MRILTILLLAAVVLAAGCVGDQGKQTNEVTTTLEQQEKTTTTLAQEAVTTTLAEEEAPTTTLPFMANLSACKTYTNPAERDSCYYGLAYKDKDMRVCDNITGADMRFKCRAHMEDKAEHCDNIGLQAEKNNCYWMMAFRWKKIDYCKKILMNQRMREECELDYIKNVGDPAGAPGKYAGECIGMTDGPIKDECIYHYIDVYYNTSEGGIKPTLCYLIENETLELKCNQTYLKH